MDGLGGELFRYTGFKLFKAIPCITHIISWFTIKSLME